ncbi:hypothetical protein VUR80DRAFT_4490 [Thermomyces stellatus]
MKTGSCTALVRTRTTARCSGKPASRKTVRCEMDWGDGGIIPGFTLRRNFFSLADQLLGMREPHQLVVFSLSRCVALSAFGDGRNPSRQKYQFNLLPTGCWAGLFGQIQRLQHELSDPHRLVLGVAISPPDTPNRIRKNAGLRFVILREGKIAVWNFVWHFFCSRSRSPNRPRASSSPAPHRSCPEAGSREERDATNSTSRCTDRVFKFSNIVQPPRIGIRAKRAIWVISRLKCTADHLIQIKY